MSGGLRSSIGPSLGSQWILAAERVGRHSEAQDARRWIRMYVAGPAFSNVLRKACGVAGKCIDQVRDLPKRTVTQQVGRD